MLNRQLKTAAWQRYIQLKEHEASLNVELDSNPEREFQICIDTHQVTYLNKFTTACTVRFCWTNLSKALEDVLFRHLSPVSYGPVGVLFPVFSLNVAVNTSAVILSSQNQQPKDEGQSHLEENSWTSLKVWKVERHFFLNQPVWFKNQTGCLVLS